MTRRNLSLFFLGAVLIIFGILWGGNSIGLWNIDVFFHGWWWLILIVMPIFGMIQHGVKGFDIVILCLGVIFLLSSLGFYDWDIVGKLIMPALVIFIGLLIIGSIFKKRLPKSGGSGASNISAVFAGIKRDCNYEVYEGGRVEAVFGGVDFDLRSAIIEQDIEMEVEAVFGGVKIFFPANVKVIPDNSAFLGGVSNKTSMNNSANVPQVRVRCNAVFGGIELY